MPQLTVLRISESRTFDDGAADPWPYLARTLLNLMTDGHRRTARDQALRGQLTMPSRPPFEDDVLNRAEAVWILRRLAVMASPNTVTLVIDYFNDELTWEQLGQRYGITATGARKQVDRALRRLRERLAVRQSKSEDLGRAVSPAA